MSCVTEGTSSRSREEATLVRAWSTSDSAEGSGRSADGVGVGVSNPGQVGRPVRGSRTWENIV
jgi:hypothetical protein